MHLDWTSAPIDYRVNITSFAPINNLTIEEVIDMLYAHRNMLHCQHRARCVDILRDKRALIDCFELIKNLELKAKFLNNIRHTLELHKSYITIEFETAFPYTTSEEEITALCDNFGWMESLYREIILRKRKEKDIIPDRKICEYFAHLKENCYIFLTRI